MQRVIACIILVGLMLLTGAQPASADVLWCKNDPLISIDGAIVDLSTSIPLKYVPLVNGPIRYEIKTPKTTSRKVILNDLGYNLHGSEVIFTDGNGTVNDGEVPVAVHVSIPIDKSHLAPGEVVPTELTIIVDNLTIMSVQGTTNKTTADFEIKGLPITSLNE